MEKSFEYNTLKKCLEYLEGEIKTAKTQLTQKCWDSFTFGKDVCWDIDHQNLTGSDTLEFVIKELKPNLLNALEKIKVGYNRLQAMYDSFEDDGQLTSDF
jgi:hypothetical protein